MLSNFKEKFILKKDECGDLFIPFKNGFVYEYNTSTFGVWFNSEKPIRSFNSIKDLYNCNLAQIGEGEFTFTYHFENNENAIKFLKFLGCYKKKVLTEKEMKRRTEQARSFKKSSIK